LKVSFQFIFYNECKRAQGSIISPALFNIFIEDLATELQEKCFVNIEDILMYADDILITCSSELQLRNCINTIEEWTARNGMSLNKKKSGIVVFAPRHATDIPLMKVKKSTFTGKRSKKQQISREWVPATKDILGVLICSNYRYLGTFLHPKLQCSLQINFIKKKAAHLFSKLYPYLAVASADGRRDMFMTFVMPLFNAALMLLKYEPSITHQKSLLRVRRGIFKQFMMISKRTNSELVEDMIRKDLNSLAKDEYEVTVKKWEARRHGLTSDAKKTSF
jgi:hypothetical protein